LCAIKGEKNKMYIVTELQTNGEATAILNDTFTDKGLALQKYHTILASAAVSEVEVYTAMIINEIGLVEYRESFDRRTDEE
jgi:hypothetical protein